MTIRGRGEGGVVIVDVHGHITHPELFKRYPMPPALADIEGMLDSKSEVASGSRSWAARSASER